jgi:hypothetical protein
MQKRELYRHCPAVIRYVLCFENLKRRAILYTPSQDSYARASI